MALIKTTSHWFEDATKEKQNGNNIVKKQKAKAIAIKYYKANKKICFFNIEKKNYESDTKNNMNQNKTNDK